MKTSKKNHGKSLTSQQRVEQYFACIAERQQIEDAFYETGNRALLSEIERARERIRETMKRIGIRV